MKAQALSWANMREQEIRDGDAGRPLKKTLADAVEKFIAEVCPLHRSGPMEARRLRVLTSDHPTIAGLNRHKQLASISVADLSAWKEKRGRQVSAGTVLRELTILQSMFEHARKDWQWIKANPVRDVRKPAKPQSRKRIISDAERDKLLTVLGYEEGEPPVNLTEQIAYMILIAMETGMRAGEITALAWRRVHLDRRFVSLEETKNGEHRDVPLSRRAVELLERLKGLDAVQVFTVSAASRDAMFRAARNRVGLADVNFHDTRHTAATRIGRAGKLSLMEFVTMFGWKDPRMATIYVNPNASDLASKLD